MLVMQSNSVMKSIEFLVLEVLSWFIPWKRKIRINGRWWFTCADRKPRELQLSTYNHQIWQVVRTACQALFEENKSTDDQEEFEPGTTEDNPFLDTNPSPFVNERVISFFKWTWYDHNTVVGVGTAIPIQAKRNQHALWKILRVYWSDRDRFLSYETLVNETVVQTYSQK